MCPCSLPTSYKTCTGGQLVGLLERGRNLKDAYLLFPVIMACSNKSLLLKESSKSWALTNAYYLNTLVFFLL